MSSPEPGTLASTENEQDSPRWQQSDCPGSRKALKPPAKSQLPGFLERCHLRYRRPVQRGSPICSHCLPGARRMHVSYHGPPLLHSVPRIHLSSMQQLARLFQILKPPAEHRGPLVCHPCPTQGSLPMDCPMPQHPFSDTAALSVTDSCWIAAVAMLMASSRLCCSSSCTAM